MIQSINIEKFDQKMKGIKNPIIFLFLLNSYIPEISDSNLCFILKIFLKNNPLVPLEINLKSLWLEELSNYPKSWEVLCNFYELFHKKINIILIIQKWYEIYDDNYFWNLSLEKQIEHLNNIKIKFLAVYDCSKGGTPFHMKLAGFSNYDNTHSYKTEIFLDVQYRLEILLKIFGEKIFKALQIPLLTVSQFYAETYQNIVIYLNVIFNRLNQLINQTIQIFEAYNLICSELYNIINPIMINVQSIHIDSETNIEDIILLSEN